MLLIDNLQFMWSGGNTRRYHGFHTLVTDTVGHHSYNVACILMVTRPGASAQLLRAALKHDMAEHIVGDMPAPTKRALPSYEDDMGMPEKTFREVFGNYEKSVASKYGVDLEEDKLSVEDSYALKIADALDGMRFCVQERQLGNATGQLIDCYLAFSSYVESLVYCRTGNSAMIRPHATVLDADVFRYLKRQWASARS